MKLLRYGDPGQEKPGLLDTEGNIRDVSAHLPDLAKQYIDPDNLAKLAGIEIDSLPRLDQSVRIGPCVGSIGKFICIGLNNSDHAAETGAELPHEPVVFSKWASSVLSATGPDNAPGHFRAW